MKRVFVLFFFTIFSIQIASAQQSAQPFPVTPKTAVIERPYCESNTNQMGILNQYTSRDDLITIISHIGKNEKTASGKRRLHNAKVFLSEGFIDEYKRMPERVLAAEGEQVDGRGRLDFWVGGELKLRVFFRKNHDFAVGECVVNVPHEKPCSSALSKLLYPCLEKRH